MGHTTRHASREHPAEGPVYSVAWQSGTSLLFAGGLLGNQAGRHDYTIYRYRLARIRAVSRTHTNTIWTLAVSPDDHYVASASQDGTVTITPI